jgi:secreted trypsin-like serine protease
MEVTLIFLSLIIQIVLGVNHKIINGALARDGQFPHMVQISIRTAESTQYCGGTLINDQWVLTVIFFYQNGVKDFLEKL